VTELDLSEYRASPAEQQRESDLMRLMPNSGRAALDIGARDGYYSLLMAERFDHVVALDLTKPEISHPGIECIGGNAQKMPFNDKSFDFVFCAEVLEHIPTAILPQVCQEIQRVAKDIILIGVPYKQDIRIGRTTCHHCGKVSPPWGHLNSFDEKKLAKLFSACSFQEISFIGSNSERTNWISTKLMDFAGNPYGTYRQEEGCTHCGQRLIQPSGRSIVQQVATKLAVSLDRASKPFTKAHGNWVHVLLQKDSA
jgi:ubiquinone/menaquinone biosynthesis C-methylase UbiE